jgi:hypothetical protein
VLKWSDRVRLNSKQEVWEHETQRQSTNRLPKGNNVKGSRKVILTPAKILPLSQVLTWYPALRCSLKTLNDTGCIYRLLFSKKLITSWEWIRWYIGTHIVFNYEKSMPVFTFVLLIITMKRKDYFTGKSLCIHMCAHNHGLLKPKRTFENS